MKVRVPKDHRPPSRFGVFRECYTGERLKVSGSYRLPREGEYFWDYYIGSAIRAQFDFVGMRAVILERVE